jgi:tetratricopeptide (TPR) repeat protein
VNQALSSIQSLDPASQQQMRQAVMMQRSGQLDSAHEIFLRLLARFPDHPELLNFLGVLLLTKRDHQGAVRALGRAREISPDRPGIDYLFGTALEEVGRHAEAIPVLQTALAAMPDSLDIHMRLARCLSAVSEFDQAKELMARALVRWSDDAELLNNVGIVHSYDPDPAIAIQSFERALEIEPNFPSAWVNLAKVRNRFGETDAGQAAIDEALRLSPNFVPALMEHASAMGNRGQHREQLKVLGRVFELDAENVEAHIVLGRARAALGQESLSRDAFLRAIELAPYDAIVHSDVGRALLDLTTGSEALEHLERATELNPKFGDAWVGLVHTYEFLSRVEDARAALVKAEEFGSLDRSLPLARAKVLYRDKRYEEAIAELDSVLTSGPLPSYIEARVHYEMAKHLDRLGEVDRAYKELDLGNSMMADNLAENLRPENNVYLKRTRELADVMTPAWVEALGGIPREPLDNGWPTPVFLLGFPRSGTTLLDQILDAHPDIVVAEEKPTLERIYEGFGQVGEFPANVSDITEEQLAVVRASYYEELSKYADPSKAKVIIDKMPLGTAKVPMLMRALPGVRFILAIRHPADCCLSCYMQDFGINMGMANFLAMDSTADLYSAVMDVWRKSADLMQPPFVRVRYEDLVDDLDSVAREVIEFLGLDWDPVVLDHTAHAKGKQINTPSYRQVSQPIYRTAKYRWERYREHLAGVLPTLAPYAEYYGYGDPTLPLPSDKS